MRWEFKLMSVKSDIFPISGVFLSTAVFRDLTEYLFITIAVYLAC